ncbi:MAG TPA: bifunctional diaminohydroxyphosphoribosylaminopyrimidine deaminase/5-amino-6-(5-phosphoribosylamino)uracil reductase RibD [Steroidobacteraceae bacterium]|nr:bifunctional diaminohydroxyphosphoribosylaminopyrimidine deaminase/5-amino-6-(5-phosphoribosylamino)uracil reductase RibD [Steroidobacteraceae bacterium]
MSGFSATDHRHMGRALVLAAEGLYSADPNPRVGCVLVRDGAVIGEGFHARAGEPHAEANALAAAGTRARGATAYVTLEPCSHHGRTPPCADALIAAGIARVIYASEDPNPKVGGGGAARLRAAGIDAIGGCLERAAIALNPGFFSRMRRGRPFVRVKLGASLDGRTALANGTSRWLTGEPARADVQRLRARSSAVLTGGATARRDDPRLTVRDAAIELRGRVPLRVVLDPSLALPPTARMFGEAGPVLVITASADAARRAALIARGAEVLCLPGAGARDLSAVLAELARREVSELLVEAGGRLAGAFIEARLVDEFVLYLAPHMLGHDAVPLAMLPMLDDLGDRWQFRYTDVRHVGEDLRLTVVPRGSEVG